jgi:probable HAF family extracellular repeat protein
VKSHLARSKRGSDFGFFILARCAPERLKAQRAARAPEEIRYTDWRKDLSSMGSRFLFLISVILLATSAVCSAEVRYAVTDLGSLAGNGTTPYGINESGQSVGWSAVTGRQHAFFHDGTSMIDLTALAANSGSFGGHAGVSNGLNDHGQVIGYARSSSADSPHASLWSTSTGMQDLGTLGGLASHAQAINNSGQVVGDADTPGPIHAFIWTSSGGMTDLGALAGNSWAYDINDGGQVTGVTQIPTTGYTRAFIWSSSTGMVPLGTLGGRHSQAFGINSLGHVVGSAQTADGDGNHISHASLYDGAMMHDLGTLGGNNSEAAAVNDFGVVVGDSSIPNDNTIRAFVYDGSQMLRLDQLVDPAPGWTFFYARDINNAGQIVVEAVLPSDPVVYALLLTPIPEPDSCALLGAGAAAIVLGRGRMWRNLHLARG